MCVCAGWQVVANRQCCLCWASQASALDASGSADEEPAGQSVCSPPWQYELSGHGAHSDPSEKYLPTQAQRHARPVLARNCAAVLRPEAPAHSPDVCRQPAGPVNADARLDRRAALAVGYGVLRAPHATGALAEVSRNPSSLRRGSPRTTPAAESSPRNVRKEISSAADQTGSNLT